MNLKLLDILACPKCSGKLTCNVGIVSKEDDILTGSLICIDCPKTYPIKSSIPCFVDTENYASSFGYQWNHFRKEQIDSCNGKQLSEKRFFSETGWTHDWMKGKWILDAGCGAGRFLDIASKSSAEVVGIDISNAVDAVKKTLGARPNIHLVQASIYELPFRKNIFDGCYCIGVIQHTPAPKKTIQSLPGIIREGGNIAITIYERKPWQPLSPKYILRHFTKRLNDPFLLTLVKCIMPIVFPITEVLYRLPLLGKLFQFLIPIANYVDEKNLSMGERYQWAIMDTFDMFAPAFDQPQTHQDAEEYLAETGIDDIRRLDNPGLNLVGKKGKKMKL